MNRWLGQSTQHVNDTGRRSGSETRRRNRFIGCTVLVQMTSEEVDGIDPHWFSKEGQLSLGRIRPHQCNKCVDLGRLERAAGSANCDMRPELAILFLEDIEGSRNCPVARCVRLSGLRSPLSPTQMTCGLRSEGNAPAPSPFKLKGCSPAPAPGKAMRRSSACSTGTSPINWSQMRGIGTDPANRQVCRGAK